MIQLQDIHRTFQVGETSVHALDSVNLTIAHGEYLSIMGPSGSGKSTLLNIIGLLDKPTSGSYRLMDEEVADLSDGKQADLRLHRIGFVFQFFHLVARMTAAENIGLPLVLDGVVPEERDERVQAVLTDYGLADRAEHRPDQLSGGQRQRVAIARATIMAPDVILADEPTGNLDRKSGAQVIEILEGLNQAGMALAVVTHDPQIGSRANRQVHMEDGCIVGDKKKRTGK